jgi:ketoreductase RED2
MRARLSLKTVLTSGEPKATDWTGRVVVVSGSARGIGASIAVHLAAKGAKVVVNAVHSVTAGQELAKQIEGCFIQADCSLDGDCRRLVAETINQYGRLDALVVNHGIMKLIPHRDLEAVDEQSLVSMFRTNVFGPFFLCRAAMPHLQKSDQGSSICLVSSLAGIRPTKSSIPYAMSKAAVNHLCLLLAKSFGPVRVNAVCPGLVETDMAADLIALGAKKGLALPIPRMGQPEEIAHAVLFTLDSSYLTGQCIAVDGGGFLAM